MEENNKGKDCPYKSITCQEGYCSECQIYLNYQGYLKTLGRIAEEKGVIYQ